VPIELVAFGLVPADLSRVSCTVATSRRGPGRTHTVSMAASKGMILDAYELQRRPHVPVSPIDLGRHADKLFHPFIQDA